MFGCQKILKMINSIYIKALLAFNPTRLFEKINQLDWYQSTLHQWVKDSQLTHNTVLEVGCSSGSLTQYLVDCKFKPTGVDLSNNSIQMAQSKYPNLAFEKQEISQLSYADNSFDNVIAASVINIVSNKQKAISEMLRVCKKGGKVSVLVPNKSFTQQQFDELLDSLNLKGFSRAALKTWNKRAPKMEVRAIQQLFYDAGSDDLTVSRYLNGMVVGVFGVK